MRYMEPEINITLFNGEDVVTASSTSLDNLQNAQYVEKASYDDITTNWIAN